MKTTILHLEAHDDVITATDRLGWAKSPRALLIWPEEGQILTRLLDLVLLQRAGRQQGTQIGLITRDPDVIDHARELGIPVFRNQKRALRGVWRRKPQRMRLLRPRREAPPDAAELRRNLTRAEYHPLPAAVRWLIFSAALLSLAALVMLFIPAARVLVPVVKTNQQMDITLWPDPTQGGITLAGGLPVEELTVEVEKQASTASSGQILLPDQPAAGEVEFTNLTANAVSIPAGTVILSTGNAPVRFNTTRAVTLLAGAGKTILCPVQAVEGGTMGNLPANSLQAVEGAVGPQAAVNNPSPTSGGTDKKAVAPSTADITRLHGELYKALEAAAAEQIGNHYVEGYHLVPGSVAVVNVIEEQQIPAAGSAGDTLTIRLKVQYRGWVVKGEILRQATASPLDAGLPAGMVGDEDSLVYKFGSLEPVNGAMRWIITARRQLQPALDVSQIAGSLVGKTPNRAASILKQSLNLRAEPTIANAPGWWPWLPLLPARINVEVY